jgi:hypothetical protein
MGQEIFETFDKELIQIKEEISVNDLVKHAYPPMPGQEYLTLFCKPKTGDASFTGSGLNDLVSGCNDYWIPGYIGEENAIYDIKISTEGTPDKYQVRKDGGSWSAEKEILGYNNILTGGTASAKNQQDSNTPDKAVDGNLDTYWRGLNNTYPTWWAYDLGEGNEKIVNRVSFRLYTGWLGGQYTDCIYKIKIQASNIAVPGDEDWTDLTSEITRRAIGIMIDFENSTAYRHYRCYIVDEYYEDILYNDEGIGVLRSPPRINEIEMYEQIVGSGYIHLGEDVYAKFTANTGHTLDEYWTINCQGYDTTNDGSTEELAFNSITKAIQSITPPLITELDIMLCDGQNYFEQVQPVWSTTRLSAGLLSFCSNSYDSTKVLISCANYPFYIYSPNLSIAIACLSTRIYKNNAFCISANYHSNILVNLVLFGDNDNTGTSAVMANYGSKIVMTDCGNIDDKKVQFTTTINDGGNVNIDTATDVGDELYNIWNKDAGIITKGGVILKTGEYDDTIVRKATGEINYYINPDTGSDDNPGTSEEPFQTIQCAIIKLPRFLDRMTANIYLQDSLNYDEAEGVGISGFIGGKIILNSVSEDATKVLIASSSEDEPVPIGIDSCHSNIEIKNISTKVNAEDTACFAVYNTIGVDIRDCKVSDNDQTLSYGVAVSTNSKVTVINLSDYDDKKVAFGLFAFNGGANILHTGCNAGDTLIKEPADGGLIIEQLSIVADDYDDAIQKKHDGLIQPNISSGTAAPSSTPTKVGDIYIDTNNKKLYFAVGILSSADWEIAN